VYLINYFANLGALVTVFVFEQRIPRLSKRPPQLGPLGPSAVEECHFSCGPAERIISRKWKISARMRTIGPIKKYRADFYSRTPLSKYDHLQFEACYNLALENNQCITMPTFLSAASMGCPEVSVAGCWASVLFKLVLDFPVKKGKCGGLSSLLWVPFT